MAFGDHLGADQHINFAAVYPRQLFLQLAFEAGAVSVNARDAQRLAFWLQGGFGARPAHLRQQLGQMFLKPLGASAYGLQIDVATLGAGARHRLGEAAVVAANAAVDLVEDAVGAAMRAGAFPVTGGAGQHRRVTPAVQEDEALLAARGALFDGVQKRR